jgi:hypothetical protein
VFPQLLPVGVVVLEELRQLREVAVSFVEHDQIERYTGVVFPAFDEP